MWVPNAIKSKYTCDSNAIQSNIHGIKMLFSQIYKGLKCYSVKICMWFKYYSVKIYMGFKCYSAKIYMRFKCHSIKIYMGFKWYSVKICMGFKWYSVKIYMGFKCFLLLHTSHHTHWNNAQVLLLLTIKLCKMCSKLYSVFNSKIVKYIVTFTCDTTTSKLR